MHKVQVLFQKKVLKPLALWSLRVFQGSMLFTKQNKIINLIDFLSDFGFCLYIFWTKRRSTRLF